MPNDRFLRPPSGAAEAVTGFARDYPAGARIEAHLHREAQLIFAAEGLMRVRSAAAEWLLPSPQALWMPAGLTHEIAVLRPIRLRTLYLSEQALPADVRAALHGRPRVVPVPPLLRALILRLVEGDVKDTGRRARLTAVLLDELADLAGLPLELPRPRDPRLLRAADILLSAPGEQRSLGELGRLAGASARTLARRFPLETGLTFTAWRQQARLLQGLAWLAEGRPVTGVAFDLGYASPSAFIAAFRRAFGVTPGRYFAAAGSASAWDSSSQSSKKRSSQAAVGGS